MSAYPSTFNPNKKVEDPKKYGVPEFEPLLKAGGHWTSELVVPEDIRETGTSFAHGRRRSQDVRNSGDSRSKGKEREDDRSVTWIIEIASQILFSNSAAVHFEVLVGRDERSLELGFAAVAGHGHGAPGQLLDHKDKGRTHQANPQKGVYSKAVKLVCEDTEALWDKPTLPKKEDIHNGKRREDRKSKESTRKSEDVGGRKDEKPMKKKKIHLVVLTHGLHSNIGADMLYLKESIDATVKQARLDARKRKAAYKAEQRKKAGTQADPQASQTSDEKTSDNPDATTAPLTGGQEELQDNDDDGSDDEEQTIVRGFTGNAVRTERGIQYLGKRLAKFVLHFTYPDQPFLPVKKSMSRAFTDSFKSTSTKESRDGLPAHNGSSIHKDSDQHDRKEDLPYTFTSISFVGHSLGGLIQTYAVAYIQKHAPHFFTQIQPINFICMASPLLGLSNENPMYVKFALDFGLVGRTGQDLGLTWRAPTLAKSGWSNLVNGFGGGGDKNEKEKEADPGAKPLLRILPTGPAHTVLRMFRNRTVYANVVNDGIVPLRTSCLLFLDWRGLGKVDKARRDNGLIGTMAEWGWAELTGANSLPKTARYGDLAPDDNAEDEDSGTNTPTQHGQGETVPQPAEDTTTDDNRSSTRSATSSAEPETAQSAGIEEQERKVSGASSRSGDEDGGGGFFDNFMSFLRPGKSTQSKKVTKALRRGQTMSPSPTGSVRSKTRGRANSGADHHSDRRSIISRGSTDNPTMLHPHSEVNKGSQKKRPGASRGFSSATDAVAPPRTSIFESASDILHPPIPSTTWLTDPSSRSRTIFHDRVYHPEDIPPPPTARRPTLGRSLSGLAVRSFSSDSISLRSSFSKDKSLEPNTNPDTSNSALSPSSPQEARKESISEGSMKVEEKIARAYHRDLSWRKVLVRLEPDAHNNMIVRRMFANAYGWPVVKHLCDTHFADTWTARMRDEDEAAFDRAQGLKSGEHVGEEGEEVKGQKDVQAPARSRSEMREERDELGALHEVGEGIDRHRTLAPVKEDSVAGSVAGSAVWDDVYFEGDSDDNEDVETDDETYGSRFQKMVGHWGLGGGATSPTPSSPAAKQTPSKKTPAQNRLTHIRSTSSSSGSHAHPILSSDVASGSFIPSPSASQHTLTPQTTKKDASASAPPLVAEPASMSESETVDPGNLTPATSGPGMVKGGSGTFSGGSLERMVTPPEPEWKDGKEHGRGSVDSQIGLRKSVEESLGSPGAENSGVRGRGEFVARLSVGGGTEQSG